jgi:hypothetical protein
MLLIPIPIVGLFLVEQPERMGLFPDGTADPTAAVPACHSVEGLEWRDIRGSGDFWWIVAAFVLVAGSIHGCVIHLPELFSDRGAGGEAAALAISVAGVAVLLGRIGTGYFLDRCFGPYVACAVFGGAAIGIVLLWLGDRGTAAVVGAYLVGLAFGAEVDIIAFLMSRYFGVRSLGTSFGFGFGALVLAGGIGPLIMGLAFDRTASYRLPLAGFFLATMLAAFMVGRLGPYRFAAIRKAAAKG